MSQSRFGGIVAIIIAVIAEIPACAAVMVFAIAILKGRMHASDDVVWLGVAVSALFTVFAIWLVLYVGVLRKRTPRRSILYFLILLIIPALFAFVVAAMFHDQRRADAARADNEVATALSDLSRAETAIVSLYQKGFAVDLHSSLPGDPGRIERATKVLLHAISDASNQFSEERDALDINGIMSPKSLAAEDGLDKATQALVAVRAAVVKRETQIDAAEAACRKVLAGAAIDPEKKHKALADFDRRMAEDKARREKGAARELDIYNEMMAIVGELKDARGGWQLKGGTLQFSDEVVLARVQRHWADVNDLEKQRRADQAH